MYELPYYSNIPNVLNTGSEVDKDTNVNVEGNGNDNGDGMGRSRGNTGTNADGAAMNEADGTGTGIDGETGTTSTKPITVFKLKSNFNNTSNSVRNHAPAKGGSSVHNSTDGVGNHSTGTHGSINIVGTSPNSIIRTTLLSKFDNKSFSVIYSDPEASDLAATGKNNNNRSNSTGNQQNGTIKNTDKHNGDQVRTGTGSDGDNNGSGKGVADRIDAMDTSSSGSGTTINSNSSLIAPIDTVIVPNDNIDGGNGTVLIPTHDTEYHNNYINMELDDDHQAPPGCRLDSNNVYMELDDDYHLRISNNGNHTTVIQTVVAATNDDKVPSVLSVSTVSPPSTSGPSGSSMNNNGSI